MGKKPTEEEKPWQSRVASLIYQLKVTLKGIRPPVWRRIEVTGETPLDRLHQILQIAMGWADIHLHEFVVNGISYGDTSMDTGRDMKNEKRVSLSKVLSVEKTKFSYIYDWGDYWEHEILLEKILPLQTGTRYPVCLAGKRACPPRIVEALRATRNCWRSLVTRLTMGMRRGLGGCRGTLTRRSSMWHLLICGYKLWERRSGDCCHIIAAIEQMDLQVRGDEKDARRRSEAIGQEPLRQIWRDARDKGFLLTLQTKAQFGLRGGSRIVWGGRPFPCTVQLFVTCPGGG